MPTLNVLAHEWGTLKDQAPQKVIDEELQAFVRLSLEALEKRVQDGENLNWDKVIETFNQNPYMQRDMEMSTDTTKRFETRRSYSLNVVSMGRSDKDEEIVKDVCEVVILIDELTLKRN